MSGGVVPPGFRTQRLSRLVRDAVERVSLDLSGVRVLTEAATGAYAVTPVLAAAAGAEVCAVTRTTRFGSAEVATAHTMALAGALGVSERIRVVTERSSQLFAHADLTTNSGHLRPIVGQFAEALRPGTALSLMFETWEIQAGRVDLDLDLITGNGVRVAGTNERHPHVDVFSYLGPMAVAQLADAGVPAYSSHVGVLCDNDFAPYIVKGLEAAGATVYSATRLADFGDHRLDAVIVAMTPTGQPVVRMAEIRELIARRPHLVIVRYWGDVDAEGLHEVWPATPPPSGHMAVLPSRVGPDAIVRLQAGGLKVGELLLRDPASLSTGEKEYIDELN